MNLDNPVVLAVASLIFVASLAGILAHYFSPEARLERRRRRNNCRVISKARRPIVTLSVRTRK
jgi:hypothetical protein